MNAPHNLSHQIMSSSYNYRVTKPTQRTLTCDTCKSRHQKCGGEQPQCSNCKLRDISCSYHGSKTRALETRELHKSSSTLRSSRLSISDADYDHLYSEIFDDIVRRLNLDGDHGSRPHEDALLDVRPGIASLPTFHREVSFIVREQVSPGNWQSDNHLIREPALERNPDHIRKILKDSLPSHDVSRHLLGMFLDYQNSTFYVCNREEAQAQLALMYEEPVQISISWYCQMFLIFAVGVQFDDIYDTDGATYYEIGQKYIDDAIDENPQSTIWIIRAMLLLCIYQPPTKWNSVWMHLDAAIRGAQRFQLDIGYNILKEISDNEYQEWRRLWLTIISVDRWVAIFLGRLPRIKESISRDPIFKDPTFRSALENTPQNNVTTLAIISGDILRDMYFSEKPSLNICRQYKSELEKWMSSLPSPLQQYVQSGEVLTSSRDQAEAIFNLHFMHLGAWMLVTKPLLFKALKTKMSSNFGGPIVSAISSEATLCIDYASRLINSATAMLSSLFPPKKSFMPVFFLINAAHIMILAAVWKLKQNEGAYGFPGIYDQARELAAIDASIQVLEFCGQRNPFARRYSVLVKELQRQLALGLPVNTFPNSTPPVPFISHSVSMTDSGPTAEVPCIQSPGISVEQSSGPTLGLLRATVERASYSSDSSLNINLESWPPSQFEMLCQVDEESSSKSSLMIMF
ncbi:hypothetical protein B0O99DRAFT_614968 [Bisporella sp. PMI_857]|nr:hypothetical protein B0O99DRAFT_614968 [Bisporella sp. PMI_857]